MDPEFHFFYYFRSIAPDSKIWPRPCSSFPSVPLVQFPTQPSCQTQIPNKTDSLKTINTEETKKFSAEDAND